MAIKTPAYFKWRDGRPRWEPGPGLRRKGFSGRDLKDDAGAWLPIGAAIDAAKAINVEVTFWEVAGEAGRRPPKHRAKTVNTVRCLYERWMKNPQYQRLARCTRDDYECKARVFLAEFGDEPLAALAHHHLYQWWEELYRERGHAMANGTVAVARTILSHAQRIGWRADNPAHRLRLVTVPPRVVVWSPSEVATFVEIGDGLGLNSCVDAVIIALHTGQRQGDVLLLSEQKIEHGRAYFRQGKTGARVAVPLTDQLAARLEAIKARRRTVSSIIDLASARRIFVRPDGRDYDEWKLRADYGKIRHCVVKVHETFAGKQFLDLRDTAITRLALASCTVAEIRAITGHSMETVHQVLKHYLALDDRMATAGIDRLKDWMKEEGIAI
jgi:hypothetical protein